MGTLKTDAATLAGDAAWIAKGKPSRYVVPILAAVHVSVVDDGLRLRMTDYDMFREVIIPAENAGAGDVAVLVDPAKLAAFLKGSKGDALVSITPGITADGKTAGGSLEISVGAKTVTLGASTAELADFPQWPEFVATDDRVAVMTSQLLKQGLTSVGKDDTLPMLTGVKFDEGNMVTTDRFRLSRIGYAADGFGALVPRQALDKFLIGKGAVSVEFGKLASMDNPAADEMRVRVSRDGRSVVARVLGAEFPKYRQLIPSESDATVVAEIRKADLLAALAGDNVDLTLQPEGTMSVSARERDGDVSVSQTIAAEIVTADGLPFTVRVCSKYVADALKGIAADVVTFYATTPTLPMIWQAGDDVHLVMPQRIPG